MLGNRQQRGGSVTAPLGQTDLELWAAALANAGVDASNVGVVSGRVWRLAARDAGLTYDPRHRDQIERHIRRT